MQIKEMFEKDIERDIKGVIKVGQNDEENIYQELDEYVVTNELSKHFSEFFANYSRGIMNPTDDIGVWISGFFGSGKSHFLKILSYLLDSELVVNGKKPIDFFENKIKDSIVLGDMRSAASVSTDVILFNIDSKASQSVSNKDDILNVFIKVFNEKRGYCGGMPFLANFEKKLDKERRFDEFKEAFKEINGNDWESERDEYYFIQDEIIQAVVKIGFMNEDEAKNWAEKAEENLDLSIEKFAAEINEYCESKGNNHHVVFLVDEVGQYIADDTKLMLNLQTIVEELGTKCYGKAWVIVTSQQNIDDITKDIKGMDFSKIQGRFKIRLSLSSSNVDEVIRRRILAKNEASQKFLEEEYSKIEATLKNILTFDGKVEMKTYENKTDFANIYPFVPYQFYRVQDVLTSIREHSASGKHMADGERSMLALFQESAIKMTSKTDTALVPFNVFYSAIENFIDHTHRIVINRAKDNDLLTDFDVEVLKVLFLIKYVKEIKASSKNITTLMITNVHEDRLELNKKIDKSLKRLVDQTLIQKNGDVYSFLTNEEQDINREIKNELVDPGEVLDEASNRIFTEIYPKNKYRFSNRYNFSFNQAIDERESSSKKHDIGMRIITPYYETDVTMGSGQTALDAAGNNLYNVLKGLSEANNEVIVHLHNDLTVFDEIKETLQISKYLRKHSSDLKAELKARKQEEYNEKNERIKLFLEESIKSATIYVKGDKVSIGDKNCENKLDEAMGKLVDKVYNKLSYMDSEPEKSDILNALKTEVQDTFGYGDTKCINALNDLDDYIVAQNSIHNKPTLKAIIERFSKAPYGFQLLDIQWLVATLFAQRKISLTRNSEEISLKKEGPSKVFDYITKKEYSEKLLISIVEKIGDKPLKATKNVIKEVYNQTVTVEDDEKLMDLFKEFNKNKLNEINDCLIEFKGFSKYPGQDKLIEAKQLLNEVNSKKNKSEFYKFVLSNEDEFLDVAEDLDPILSFFSGTQKTIFRDSYNVYRDFESNQNLIQREELSEIAMSIKRILDMPNPYSNIKNLPQLNKDFEDKLEVILDSERKFIINDINSDYETVLSYLTDEDLKNKFEGRFKLKFDSLIDKLNKEKNISIINGITDESDNLRANCLNEVQKFIIARTPVEVEPGNPEPPEEPEHIIKEVSVPIKEIVFSSKVRIKTEDELNEFLEQVKNRVKNELEDNDIVNLKF